MQAKTITAGSARRPPPGFTMIELLVVVAILGLLTALVAVVAPRAIYSAKARNTEQVMANVELAIDVFRTEDPLRLTYNLRDGASFGPYPPYQLANHKRGDFALANVMELADAVPGGVKNNLLSDRLWIDLGQERGAKGDWVRLGSSGSGRQDNERDGNDDIRALYAYLRAFSPAALDLIPPSTMRALHPDGAPDLINPRGRGPNPGNADSSWVDALGVFDAWDVPLDYMLFVKLQWGVQRNPTNGNITTGYVVKDWKPVLRSRGMERDQYEAWRKLAASEKAESGFNDPERWLFSTPLPQPWIEFANPARGQLRDPGNGRPPSGWARAVALEVPANPKADYRYLPSDDALIAKGR